MSNPQQTKSIANTRFGILDGQFFAKFKYKNLWWELDGVLIGFGDLRDQDIQAISELLYEKEEFVGWNEHHFGGHRQTETPMVRIKLGEIKHRIQIVEEEGR